jgi:serine phosphatase RsbU (regulator of sigma subunit)
MAKDNKEPGELMKELNEFIKEDFAGSDMYLTAFCGLLDMRRMELMYSNYGHPPQYTYDPVSGRVKELSAQTSLLGLPYMDDGLYQDTIAISREERLVLYTDGISETFNAGKQQYGEERIRDFRVSCGDMSTDGFNNALIKDLKEFKTGSFRDDICVMSIFLKSGEQLASRIIREEKHMVDRILDRVKAAAGVQ